ncbi:TlpA disulfide reductase family protein [Arenibacter sp. ARW7G5Y1]|uniref:TlpA family protein disulfide reductase n=1 Tax=Arenibacter sp. ARW7G5Y1 TaxID=2135619 RepID=UPI000D757A04|nr:TlpA disulfide reductase family protein [Arenibacter sp. ARW7G5Y1]PXX23255.1 thiol-disulfide isomerase/thioredoxin [Arenibacter sp. ARW7G5Y1]
MVPNRKWIFNGVLILAVLVLLFTPVGFYIKVYVNRILAFNPTPVEAREQQLITDYHWKLQDLGNSDFNFEQVKDEVVLINFWASWCPPCVAEMPSLQNLYRDYGDKVIFMFVAQDQQKRVEKFLKKGNYELPVYYENSTTPKQLFSKSIPSTYIIDRGGRIVVAKTGAADWNSSETRMLLDGLLGR